MASSTLSFLQDLLNRYTMPACMILGNIGNACNMFVLSKHRQSVCSMYLLSASVMNIFFLTFIISFSVYIYDHDDPTVHSPTLCKLRTYFPHVWGQMGRYCVVLASIDRFAMTSTNASLRALSRPIVARWILSASTAILHVLGAFALVMTTVQNGRCGQFGVYLLWYNVYSIATIAIIPLGLTTIFGSLAYLNRKRFHLRVRPLGNDHDVRREPTALHRRDRELLKMVLAEVSVHFVTNLLYPVIIIEVVATSYMNAEKSSLRLQIENFILLIARILFYTSNAASFYIFCTVSGNFRREFKQILCKRCFRTTGQAQTVSR